MDIAKFIEQELRPTAEEILSVQNAFAEAKNIFENTLQLEASEYTETGSFAKKTLLKGEKELHLIGMVQRASANYNLVIQNIEKVLKKNYHYEKFENQPYQYISFKISNILENYILHFYPCFKINSPIQMGQAKYPRQYYASATVFHSVYISKQKRYHAKFFDFVRLLKMWRKKNHIPLDDIQLEILASLGCFNTAHDGTFIPEFRNMLTATKNMIEGQTILPVNWNKYDETKITAVKSYSGVLIIDPANPATNLANNISINDLKFLSQNISETEKFMDPINWESILKL